MKKNVLFGVALGVGLMAGISGANAGDAAEGKKAFRACQACHTMEAGKNRVGPSLNGVVGRKAGTVDGFAYSQAMKSADIVWDEENLKKYLADPKGFIPGNKMVYAGMKKEEDLNNLLAYLKEGN